MILRDRGLDATPGNVEDGRIIPVLGRMKGEVGREFKLYWEECGKKEVFLCKMPVIFFFLASRARRQMFF